MPGRSSSARRSALDDTDAGQPAGRRARERRPARRRARAAGGGSLCAGPRPWAQSLPTGLTMHNPESRGQLQAPASGDDDHVEHARAVDALDAVELDVRRRGRAGDERDRAALARGRASAATASGHATGRSSPRATMQTWWSGTSVSARRPDAGPESSTIVPVSAIASAEPVTTRRARRARRSRGRRPRSTSRPSAGEPGRDADARGVASDRATAAPRSAAATRCTVARYSATRSQNSSTIAVARERAGRAVGARDLRRGGRPERRARVADAARGRRPSRRAQRAASRHQSRNVSFGRLREVAHRGPARGRRPCASGPRPSRASRCARLVAAARAERGGHALHRQRLGREPGLLLAHDPPAQVHEHGRDVDLDRADLVARAAQRRRPRQRRRRVQARAAAA